MTMKCDTCSKETKSLKRLVLDKNYDALNKVPLWNCKVCYEEKNKKRKLSLLKKLKVNVNNIHTKHTPKKQWANLSVECKIIIFKCIIVALIATFVWVKCGEAIDRIDEAARLKALEEDENG